MQHSRQITLVIHGEEVIQLHDNLKNLCDKHPMLNFDDVKTKLFTDGMVVLATKLAENTKKQGDKNAEEQKTT